LRHRVILHISFNFRWFAAFRKLRMVLLLLLLLLLPLVFYFLGEKVIQDHLKRCTTIRLCVVSWMTLYVFIFKSFSLSLSFAFYLFLDLLSVSLFLCLKINNIRSPPTTPSFFLPRIQIISFFRIFSSLVASLLHISFFF